MKKLIIALVVASVLCGCNRGIFDLEYKFSKAEIRHFDGSREMVRISKWWDFNDSDMIQVLTSDGKIILTHSVNVILIKE